MAFLEPNLTNLLYITLDNAYIFAQNAGQSDELCEPDSKFSVSLQQCLDCHDAYNVPIDDTLPGQLQQFISYCEPRWNSTELQSALSVASEYGYSIIFAGTTIDPGATGLPATTTDSGPGTSGESLKPVTITVTPGGKTRFYIVI